MLLRFERNYFCYRSTVFLNYSNSPSLPPGFSAAAAKHRGHDALKSTSLCIGIPFLKRIDVCLLFRISFLFELAVSATKTEKKIQCVQKTFFNVASEIYLRTRAIVDSKSYTHSFNCV